MKTDVRNVSESKEFTLENYTKLIQEAQFEFFLFQKTIVLKRKMTSDFSFAA